MDLKNGIMKYRVVFAEGRGVAWDDREPSMPKEGVWRSGLGRTWGA